MSHAPGEESPPQPPRAPARYSMLVGLAFLALIAYVTLNTTTNDEGGLLGADASEGGTPLAEFAVPDVRGTLEGDANIFQDDCERASNPCPAAAERTPACRVAGEGVIRVCDLFDRPLAISFWFTRGGDCLPTQDVFDRVAARFDGVNFLSVNVRDDIDEVRSIVAERGWSVPVGWDADGAVSNIYRVGLCPTVALAYPGGILRGALLGSGELTEARLSSELRALVSESRRRAARAR